MSPDHAAPTSSDGPPPFPEDALDVETRETRERLRQHTTLADLPAHIERLMDRLHRLGDPLHRADQRRDYSSMESVPLNAPLGIIGTCKDNELWCAAG